MTLASSEPTTDTQPAVFFPAAVTGTATATSRSVRPVFVDDGGRRKLVLVRAGYLAVAVFVGYLVVIAVNLTVLPSGPLGRAVAVPTGGATPQRGPDPRPSAIAPPADVDPVVVPKPPAVERVVLAVRPTPAAIRTTTPHTAATTRRPTTSKKPVASSAPSSPPVTSAAASTTAVPQPTTAAAAR